MPGEPQPLVNNQKIVHDDGTPTDYFIRWAQTRQIDIASGITAEEAQQLIVDFLAAHPLTAGTGISITPSGSIADDVTIALNAVLGNLNDVDLSTPPTNGQVLVYDDVSMTWKPADQSGGGGGGGGPVAARYWRIRGMRGGNASTPTDGLGYTLVNFRAGATALIPTPGLSGFANATDTGGGWTIAAAFDGSSAAAHGWYSGSGNAGEVIHSPYLGYDFGAAVTPTKVEYAPLTGFPWTIGQIVAIEYSDDKVIWKTLCLIENRAGADHTVESYTLPPAASAVATLNGARVHLDANYARGGGADVPMLSTTSIVEYDTASWWDAANQWFVVPAGVAYAELTAQRACFGGTATGLRLYKNTTPLALVGDVTISFIQGTSGVIAVAPGDTLRPFIFGGSGYTLDASDPAFTWATVRAAG